VSTTAASLRLQVFEGPFDLLLELISRRKIDLKKVSLTEIAHDYLNYLEQMEELDLEIATEFLVVAATLVNIKAERILMPTLIKQEELPLPETPEELMERLKEYRVFKEVAQHLAAKFEGDRFYPRCSEPEARFLKAVPLFKKKHHPKELEALVRRLFHRETISLETLHSVAQTYRLDKKVQVIKEALKRQKTVRFSQLASKLSTRGQLVALFLAFLELLRNGEIEAVQKEVCGEIEIKLRKEKLAT
jgi:segregation and condensation protein A